VIFSLDIFLPVFHKINNFLQFLGTLSCKVFKIIYIFAKEN